MKPPVESVGLQQPSQPLEVAAPGIRRSRIEDRLQDLGQQHLFHAHAPCRKRSSLTNASLHPRRWPSRTFSSKCRACTKSSSVPLPAGLNAIVTSDSRSGVVRGHVQVKASLRLGTTSV